MIAILYALWFGILTSISPCPLAGNIAAVSFIGRKVGKPYYVLLSGLMYTLGRAIFYTILGVILSFSMHSIPMVSNWLQTNMTYVAGPLLVFMGMIMLGVIDLHLPKFKMKEGGQSKLDKMGLRGALILGFLFASMLCPVSAAFFFSNLIQSQGNALVLATYGIGTGLPVMLFALVLAFFANKLSSVYKATTVFEKYARLITASIFIVVGVYYLWRMF
jgi:cytochrome c-type biogenesis protein